MKWKRVVGYSTAVLLLCILGTTPAKGEPNRWEEWRSLNSVGGLFPQIVGLQQLPVVDFLGYPTSSITNPSTGRGRVFYSTTDSLMHCLNSDGSSCFASAGGSGTVTGVSFTGGLITVATPTTTPALTVAGTSGGIPYFSSASTWASSAAGTVNTLMKWGGAGNPPLASICTDNATSLACAGAVTSTTEVDAGVNGVAAGVFGLLGSTSGKATFTTNATGGSTTLNGTLVATGLSATSLFTLNGRNIIAAATPTIATGGCGGSGASIVNAAGTASFNINVGTGPTSAGCTITLGAATNEWNCSVNDPTTVSATVLYQKQTGYGTTTATFQNFTSAGSAGAPTASDIYHVTCMAH